MTGSAGTGKSAIVGRVVSLSNPEERRRLAQAGSGRGHADPGERSVAAHVHARGLTADRMAESAGRSARAVGGVGARATGGRRNAAELVGALQRAAEAGASPRVLVVDGLDEARGEAFTIATDLLVRLARYASVVVSTRPVARAEPPTSLVGALQPDAVLDLDEPVHRASGRVAMRGYVVARLAGRTAEMDPAVVADRLVGKSSQPGDRPFLLARVVTDQLRAAPIDTSTPNWERYLARSIESAFDVDLARVAAPGAGLPAGTSPAGLARAMLTALTWAFGAGFPEEEWLAVASPARRGRVGARARQLGARRAGPVRGAGRRGRYRGVSGGAPEPGRSSPPAVPAHRGAAVRPGRRAGVGRAWPPVTQRCIDAGYPAAAPTYLWRYAYRHAAAAGLTGLTALRELAAAAEELRPDIGARRARGRRRA